MVNSMDSRQFMMLSSVEMSPKRDFIFSMKRARSESLDRTQASINQNPGHMLGLPVHKRPRKFDSKEEKNFVEKLNGEDGAIEVIDNVNGDVKKEVHISGKNVEVNEEIEDGILVNTSYGMKVSKTSIVRKRYPTNLKEFLATRILEGLPVNYLRSIKARETGGSGLHGVISGNGILCHCKTCHGQKVVTATKFEMHAGSSNKRPAEHIYLEDGSTTLRDVINTCSAAPLDTLEEAVQKVLGSFIMKKSIFCFNCRGVNVISGLLCNLCSIPKEEDQPSSTQIAEISNPWVPVAVQFRDRKPIEIPGSSSKEIKHTTSQANSDEGRLTWRDQRLHQLVFDEDVLPNGTKVAYFDHGQRLLDGYKQDSGIMCGCCNAQISPSEFEVHAGWFLRGKPYLHIYTSEQVSLSELAIKICKERGFSLIEDDELYSISEDDEGYLLCCDGCPRVFRLDCAPLPSVPTSTWYCKYCVSSHQKGKHVQHNASALAARRVDGADTLAQIQQRSTGFVEPETVEHEGCLLCRRDDFTKPFSPQTMMICEQCEKEYHVKCLKEHNIEDLKELPEGNWFCSSDCNELHAALVNVVTDGEKNVPESLLSLIKRKHEEKGLDIGIGLDIKWRVLNWHLLASEQIKGLLSKAVSILHDRFEPMFSASSKDLIPAMLFGSDDKSCDFHGMYCAILSVNQEIVSVGLFRVFGQEVAELPLVATPKDCEGKGYFRALLTCIERLLASLKVRHLVLPASKEAESIWTDKFGFARVEQEELNNYERRLRLMQFHKTQFLQKLIPEL